MQIFLHFTYWSFCVPFFTKGEWAYKNLDVYFFPGISWGVSNDTNERSMPRKEKSVYWCRDSKGSKKMECFYMKCEFIRLEACPKMTDTRKLQSPEPRKNGAKNEVKVCQEERESFFIFCCVACRNANRFVRGGIFHFNCFCGWRPHSLFCTHRCNPNYRSSLIHSRQVLSTWTLSFLKPHSHWMVFSKAVHDGRNKNDNVTIFFGRSI